jgi:uncharacterized membrane protein required for colicin V production
MEMTPYIIDCVVLAIILFELLMGLRRGLSGELFRLIGTCLVLAISLRFYGDFGLMIAEHSRLGQNQEMALALAFLLITAGMSVCIALLRIVFTLLVTVKFNEAFDRPAGGAAGGAHGAVIAAIIVFAAGLWPNEQLQAMIKVDSYFGRTIFKFAPAVTEKIRAISPAPRPSADRAAPEPVEVKPDNAKTKSER